MRSHYLLSQPVVVVESLGQKGGGLSKDGKRVIVVAGLKHQ